MGFVMFDVSFHQFFLEIGQKGPLTKKICSQELWSGKKRARFVKSFNQKKSENFDENWKNGECFSKFGQLYRMHFCL